MHESDANRRLADHLVAGLAAPRDERAILASSQEMLSEAVRSVVNAGRTDLDREPTMLDVLEALSLAGRRGGLDDA